MSIIGTNRKIVNDCLNGLLKAVTDYVASRGGFIDTQNIVGACDDMFAYCIDPDTDLCTERSIYGVRVKDGQLQIATEVIATGCEIRWSDEDFDDAEWENVSGGDYIFFAQTLLSIAESIEQY